MDIYVRNVASFAEHPRVVIQCLSNTAMISRLVGNALMYALDMEEVAVIDGTESLPSVAIVKNGVIQYPIRIYSSENIFLVFSEITIPNNLINAVVNSLFKWYQEHSVERVYTISGVTTVTRPAKIPSVLVALSHGELSSEIEDKGLVFLERGAIYGSVGLSLINGKKYNIPVISLIAETKSEEADFETTIVLLEAIKTLTGLNISIEHFQPSSFPHYFPDESEVDEEGDDDFDDEDDDYSDNFPDDYFDPTDLL